MIALTVFFPNPILILVLLFGGIESWRKQRNTPEARALPRRAHPYPRAGRVVYLGLAALLAVGVTETFFERDLGDV